MTNYLIPTLEEAVKVAKGRMFLYCDKLTLKDDTNSYDPSDMLNVIFPIFAKYEAWDTMMFVGEVGVAYGYYCLNDLKTKIPESAGGLAPYYLAQLTTSTDEKWTANVGNLKELGMPMIARFSGWEDNVADVDAIDTFIGQYSTNFNAIKDRIRLHADCYNYENETAFNKLLDYGINGAMVNDPLSACQFVAKTYYND